MIKPWPNIESKQLGDFRIFKVRNDLKVSPRTGRRHDFMVLECGDWVNVIAVTPDRHLVMVEQFRHGANRVELEIPGGLIDPGDPSPVAAGVRELREETGYEGRNARLLGQVSPNPAIMSNICYTVLVEDCVPAHAVEFDHGEDIQTRLTPLDELCGLVRSGTIQHSLVVVALAYFDLWRRDPAPRA